MADRLTGVFSPWLRRRRFAAVQRFIKAGQVLDYGCGIGLLAQYIPAERYVGLDVDEPSLEQARQEFPTHRFFHVSEFIPDRKFDTMLMVGVILYIPDPEQFLRWALGLLNPSGKVVVTVPKPTFDPLLILAGRLGLIGRDFREEHVTLLDKSGFDALARKLKIPMVEYSTFLFGANQLAVYQNPVERQVVGTQI
jgi:2-polyprenyl-3-methyl-5-hydroxy-6-metoxy-1,4-benzoquinol methylase